MIKILVVDDSALVRKLIGQVFSTQSDFEVRFARNGREALDIIKVARPDVLTLDVHMPEMDGLTGLDRIMIEQPCPVIMVSTMTAEGADATLEALRLGAVDFVAKPTRAVSLRIEELAQPLIEKVAAALPTPEANDLADARKAFLPFTTATVDLAKIARQQTPFRGVKIFKCPMAPKPGQTSFWIQLAGPLRNPFYGSEMIDCLKRRRKLIRRVEHGDHERQGRYVRRRTKHLCLATAGDGPCLPVGTNDSR